MKRSINDSSLAIILLNWNGYEFTRACLESLQLLDYPDFEIIVVDNGSTDGSVGKLETLFKGIIFLTSSENLGFTGGNNLGIRYALKHGFQNVLLLNNDTIVEKNFVKPLIRHLQATPSCAAVQPLIYYLHDQQGIWNAGGRYKKWLGKSETSYVIRDPENPYPTDWITGCAFMIKSSVIKKVGLLDTAYFAYYEDVDWSLRIKAAGMELAVVPQSVIYHEAGASSKSKVAGKEGFLDAKVHFLNVRNQLFQLRKHVVFPYGCVAWPYTFVKIAGYAAYFVIRQRWGKLNAIGRGIKEGLKNKNELDQTQ